MSGFVRGGRDAQPARESVRSGETERAVLTDPTREVVVVDGDTARVITDDQSQVVAAEQRNPLLVHVVEPVGVDPRTLVAAEEVPVNEPLVWRVDANGVWRYGSIDEARWGEEIRFADEAPDPSQAPLGATWVDFVEGTIHKAEEA